MLVSCPVLFLLFYNFLIIFCFVFFFSLGGGGGISCGSSFYWLCVVVAIFGCFSESNQKMRFPF
jgi:hypothetical protein